MKKRILILAFALVIALALPVTGIFADSAVSNDVAAKDVASENTVSESDNDGLSLWSFFSSGTTLSVIGIFIAVGLSGIGSAKGVGIAGRTAAGVVSEDPSLSGKCTVLEALPATQGIYGFVAGFLVLIKNGVLAGQAPSFEQGMILLCACLPVGIVGLLSAIHQGRVAAAGMQMMAKQKDKFAMGITYSAMVETYAILALLISALMILMV